MCGICGFTGASQGDLPILKAMCDIMAHRGPDGEGQYLDDGIALYFAGAAPKIIMSGDNSTVSYNEVKAMKDYAVAQGVPSEDVFCDHAGFSTYESMYRAKHVFGAERIVVATQTYHLYRALYAASGLGLEAVGVLWGYGDLQELEASHPVHIVESFDGLKRVLI